MVVLAEASILFVSNVHIAHVFRYWYRYKTRNKMISRSKLVNSIDASYLVWLKMSPFARYFHLSSPILIWHSPSPVYVQSSHAVIIILA